MCGIAGYLQAAAGPADDEAERRLRRMIAAIAHRGPDSDGIWADPEAGVGFGHKRLSIVDLSAAGAQPMTSHSGRYVTVYNGEIYNHADLRREIDASGAKVAWRGHSDTETMLAGFDLWGIPDTIRRCVGMFAIAVWDRQDRVLTLARDRIGEKPLYYGWQGEGDQSALLFGSELKALRAHPSFGAGIDRDSLCLFFRHSYIGEDRSVYRAIRKVEPGCLLQVSAGAPEPVVVRYWCAAEVASGARSGGGDGLEPDEAVDALEELLKQAVGQQMVADVPVGAFLSGGVDSSAVVALMQACSNKRVHTFSIGFDDDALNEAGHARRVADHLGTEHTELYVGSEELLGVVPRLPHIYDEPFGDSSQIPTILVSELARRHVTVSISGDGGDELFCGYPRYLQAQKFWRGIGPLPGALRRVAADAVAAVPARYLSGAARLARPGARMTGQRIQRVAGYATSGSLAELHRSIVSHWTETPVIDGAEPDWILSDPGFAPGLCGIDKMMLLDVRSYLPDDVLAKVDRATMSTSLESRAPLLDHRVVEFALRLPLACKVRDGQQKWALRQLLYRYVPKALVERPKMGFSVPIASWLRGPLREWAEDLLAAPRLRREGFLKVEPVRRKWSEHLSGSFDWSYHLWNALMFQAWLEAQETV